LSSTWGQLPLLADTSAWARSGSVLEPWTAAMTAGRISTCDVVVLELLYSARTHTDVVGLASDLSVLRQLAVTRTVTAAAVSAVVELSARGADGSHRLPPADAIVAACAAENGCAVLHYDAHYDRLAEVLGFESVWVAPAGSIS
jgi:predicted nucleic acid-binding protein